MKDYKESSFPHDIKKTRQREEIYYILLKEAKPVSAVDIYQRLVQMGGDNNFAISTVYRALAAFEEKGYVVKSVLTSQNMAYYEWNKGNHKHYAICLKCNRMIPLKECPFQGMNIETGKDGFTITGHKMELYGYCRGCSPKD